VRKNEYGGRLRIPSEGREERESMGRGMTETSPNPVGVALRPGRR